MKLDGIPFKIVFDKILDTRNVIKTPRIITPVKISVENNDCKGDAAIPTKNIDISAIIVGNLPLQGTKQLVIIAISLSLGESIILHPTIPAALQPKPMHMVNIILNHNLH